jgi:hypothetical protein
MAQRSPGLAWPFWFAALLLMEASSLAAATVAPGAFSIAISQSASGNLSGVWLKDEHLCCMGNSHHACLPCLCASFSCLSDIWNEAVNGYRFWQSLIPSSGFTIQDGASPPNSFPFTFTLDVLDDQSSQSTHIAQLEDQVSRSRQTAGGMLVGMKCGACTALGTL